MQDSPAIRGKVAAYLLLKQEIEERKALQESLKKELDPYLLQADTNGRGSHVIAFGEVLEIHGKRYASLQKQRKESKLLNEERALKLLKDKSDEGQWTNELYLSPIITIEHIKHAELWDLFAQDLLTEEEYDSLFDVTVTWAFAPTKE